MLYKSKIAVFSPTGNLGDLFVTTGAIKYFSLEHDSLIVPVLNRHLDIGVSLFKEQKNIHTYGYDRVEDLDTLLQSTGYPYMYESHLYQMPSGLVATDIMDETFEDYTTLTPLWDEQTYTGFNIPFSIRYQYFQWPNFESECDKLYDSVVEGDYILIADEVRPWRVAHPIRVPNPNNYQVIKLVPELCPNPLYYHKLLLNAKEIHCVSSSMFCLIDSIAKNLTAKLYHHDSRHTPIRLNNRWNGYKWNNILYPETKLKVKTKNDLLY